MEKFIFQCGRTLNRCKLRFFYSAQTHYILNVVTLGIKDKEVEKEYNIARINHFDAQYHKIQIFMLLYFVFRVY